VKITRNVFWIPFFKYLLSAPVTTSREVTRNILGQLSNPNHAEKCLYITTDKNINKFYAWICSLDVRRFFSI